MRPERRASRCEDGRAWLLYGSPVLAVDVLAFVRAALPPAPARVLDVGAGDGELAEALREAGYDVLAIDPASRSPAVRAVALHELEAPAGGFDAATAVVSLHHLEPLAESCRRLATLVRPGGILIADELDVQRLDERAARWWLAQRRARGEDASMDARELVADMRGHVHALDDVLEALRGWFTLGSPVRGPYLHRWHLPPGLRHAEEQGIAEGWLPAFGARLVGVRNA